jgi:phospholipid/cholesterol/gamma-HCH transport system permease protein
MHILFHIGRFAYFLKGLFLKPEKLEVYRQQIFKEIESIGYGSLGIVCIISIFLGAVVSVQTAHNLFSAFVPVFVIGIVTRDSIVIEFAPTIMGLVLAGKVGSSIASEIGTMRVTEQIDALEIMGINSSGYLVLPKIIAAMVIIPFLVVISMFLGIVGGLISGQVAGVISYNDFIYGFNVTFALIKAFFFSFTIVAVSSYHGYYTEGGALEVGKASTNAVVYSSILILIIDYILTQLLLA